MESLHESRTIKKLHSNQNTHTQPQNYTNINFLLYLNANWMKIRVMGGMVVVLVNVLAFGLEEACLLDSERMRSPGYCKRAALWVPGCC